MKKIPFNKPYLVGNETKYIKNAVNSGKISGNGMYTQKCQHFFETKYQINKALLTTSCTDALEMCALLLNIKEGDEVIMPSFTFVSTANAFILRGAKIVFVDSRIDQPNIDENKIEAVITSKTKAIVVVHYAGVACEMDTIMSIANRYGIFVVEDAAQAIDSYYKDRPLGSIGHLGTFSFHETKNLQCGEGGLLAINDMQFADRAEIIWEKGTNRSAFFRGEVDKYGWVDVGSSFLPSELNAAFLWAQIENLKEIQRKRKKIWEIYYEGFKKNKIESKSVFLPKVPIEATNNGHMFYLICNSVEERTNIISYLNDKKIFAVFHYLSLHKSTYFKNKHDSRVLNNSDNYTDKLLRLPLYYELLEGEQQNIISHILNLYNEI